VHIYWDLPQIFPFSILISSRFSLLIGFLSISAVHLKHERVVPFLFLYSDMLHFVIFPRVYYLDVRTTA